RDPGALVTPAPSASTVPVSPVVAFVIRLVTPFSALFAGYVLLHGHSSPGGGFQAGSILGGIFIVLTVIVGREHTLVLLPRRVAPLMQGTALISFIVVGILGAVLTGYFLGFPAVAAPALTELMITVIEIGIGLGGAAIFATIFLQMEAE
ncbi:MAG: MnhB domain-containing protein, partial [Coriobacteriia bacterium]|nr:MnhB domain-containing protein [Coriobacteriia bacterium]